jgi:hypothetical protein
MEAHFYTSEEIELGRGELLESGEMQWHATISPNIAQVFISHGNAAACGLSMRRHHF